MKKRLSILFLTLDMLIVVCSFASFAENESLKNMSAGYKNIFENADLYLRMMAAGLLQLFEKLSADGEFVIDLVIAVRYVPDDQGNLVLIEDEEYLSRLREYILDLFIVLDVYFSFRPIDFNNLAILLAVNFYINKSTLINGQ